MENREENHCDVLASACIMLMKKIERGEREGKNEKKKKFCFFAQTGRNETRKFA